MSNSRVSDNDGPLVAAARSAEGTVRNLKEVGSEKLTDAIDSSREIIRENPMRTVLIAAGVGALLGYMIGRRR
jgi:ElaB/YqjD/DUF883 family membrane-anchored ribosome-binding protein